MKKDAPGNMKIIIDNKYYEVDAGKNLLEACIGLGLDLPYFCYHPALGSVGACRQCAVKKYANAADNRGRIIMACMEPVTEGMIISIRDKEVSEFRAGVIEGLMTNHPHDCPVCDEGGECHLQDMTVMTGHNYRKFTFKKRTYNSQNLGPFIHHEMNRCIQCYRCVRFYRDYAGGKDLNVFGSSNMLYFGRKEDGILESEFSGNLVEVCPTGVFTDKTLKNHYTRKWDLTSSPSVCMHCSLGCNTFVGERYGMVRRVLNRYHGEINGYFLCDRGRFGYEFLHHPSRIKSIILPDSENVFQGLGSLSALLPDLADAQKNHSIIGIGSPRASLESNFALLNLVGKERFFSGISRSEQHLTHRALELLNSENVNSASLKDIEKCDFAIILNQDVTQTAPVMALSLRQMVRRKAMEIAEKAGIPAWNDAAARELAQHNKSPLYIAHPFKTRLEDAATGVYYQSPADIARLGFAIAAAIDPEAPLVPDMSEELKQAAGMIASDLVKAKNPLIVTGISGADDLIFYAIGNLIRALNSKNKKPSLAIVFPENNSVGLASLNARSIDDVADQVNNESSNITIILENDIFRRMSYEKAEKFLKKSKKVIVIDHLMNETGKRAHIVLPAAAWAESSGTVINNESRAQRYHQVLPGNESIPESWQWISEMMKLTGQRDNIYGRFDDVVNSLSQYFPELSAIKDFPDSKFRYHHTKVARQTMRFSGRTAIDADISVSEPKPPEDTNSPLKFSMEGYNGRPPAGLIPFYWAPGWNSPQAVNKYLDEPNGSIKDGDPGKKVIPLKQISITRYFEGIPGIFKPDGDSLYLVPVPVIFGSEELSARGEAISKLTPAPFLMINENEAARRRVKPDEILQLSVSDKIYEVVLRTDNTLPDGVAGLSTGLPGLGYIDLPASGKVINTL